VLLEIRHRTRYTYGVGVFLHPHTLRLRPATDVAQKLLHFELGIEPSPSGVSDNVDLDGNDTSVIWFDDRADGFVIDASSRVETLRSNPFDFLWLVEPVLPLRYPDAASGVLAPYLQSEHSDLVGALARGVSAEHGHDARAFLTAVTARMHASCRQIRRETGDPRPAAETLARGEGSCRDLAVVLMEACRGQGIAARFVSGYHAVAGAHGFDLHAWVEVYLPGGGWRGFDPSTGLAVSDAYVALARSAAPAGAAPVSGSFLGAAQAEPESQIWINRLGEG
jgi:transglutaminase-like putative cysteine protease